jgi:secreted PhoX family phosphatase
VVVEIAARGASLVEPRHEADRRWRTVRNSRFKRRITGATPMRLSGPAARHPRLRTHADPSGTRMLGTLNNCAGERTP